MPEINSYVADFLTPCSEEISTGTTIIACEYDDGVILGADSRTSSGIYVANRVTDKLTRISDSIYCCRAGSAADTQAIADIVRYHLSFHEMELGEPPLVEVGASVARELLYNYRDSLTAALIVAGWDKRKGGQVYSLPIGGMCTRQPIALSGSGSGFIYGFVDSNYKPNMSKEDCIQFVIKAIALAIKRDGSSGGCCRIGVLSKDGLERRVILGTDLPVFN